MSLENRSQLLVEVFEKYIPKDCSILEVGFGDGRNLHALRMAGYNSVEGIDKANGMSLEEVSPTPYDVIFSMSTLFLIPEANDFVFEKMANMAQKWIITIEGETTKGHVIGRDYYTIFTNLGFEQVYAQAEVFNKFGVLRVFKKK